MKNRTVEYCTYCNLNIVDICKLKVRFNLFLNFNYHRAHLCGLENKPQFNQTIHIFLLLHFIVFSTFHPYVGQWQIALIINSGMLELSYCCQFLIWYYGLISKIFGLTTSYNFVRETHLFKLRFKEPTRVKMHGKLFTNNA